MIKNIYVLITNSQLSTNPMLFFRKIFHLNTIVNKVSRAYYKIVVYNCYIEPSSNSLHFHKNNQRNLKKIRSNHKVITLTALGTCLVAISR
jgi:hypothetical protein